MYKITVPAAVWQWDINDTVTVEGIENISEWQVHFATVGDTTALVIEIKPDMTAYIPNQLVELGAAIYAYLYNVREERAYTETAILIPVSARPKPNDYISEPTDVLTWGQLRADIGTLSQLVTEDKTNLVAAVNELHRDIETAKTEQDKDITAIQSDIDDIKQDITDIKDTDAAQSRQIAQNQQDIDELAQSDTQLAESVSSLAQTVDKGFEQISTELDEKQPKGDYITNAVDNLVNYYRKSETYTQSEVNDLIGSLTHINIKIVSSIDDVTEPNVIYLVPASSGESDDYYNEYILVNGSPELIGNTRVDLSDYYTREQTDDLLNKKQPIGNYITSVNDTTPDENGNVSIDVQTYTAGDGIRINEGAISVTNPMDDDQVSETTTWSSAKIISSVSQPFSQSGSIITCYPVDGSPLHVVSEITAVQEGEGDPSPDNVRPIVGWTGANLVRCGTNLIGGALEPYPVSNNAGLRYGYATEYVPSGNYQWNAKLVNANDYQKFIYIRIIYIDNTLSDYNYITTENNEIYTIGNFVLNQKGQIVLFPAAGVDGSSENKAKEALDKINVQISPTAQSQNYEPYRGQTYTADFGETVYGGTLDWSTGVLTVDRLSIVLDGSEMWHVYANEPLENISTFYVYALYNQRIGYHTSICSSFKNVDTAWAIDQPWIYSDHNNTQYKYFNVPTEQIPDLDSWKTYLSTQKSAGTPVQLVYQLQTPYTIQLTPAQILAISGTNTVYCDTGDVTVTGYEDPRTTIVNLSARIAALESAATEI